MISVKKDGLKAFYLGFGTAVAYLASSHLQVPIITPILGLFCLFIIPGLLFNKLINLDTLLGKLGSLVLIPATSVAIVNFTYIVLGRYSGFYPNTYILITLGLIMLLSMLRLFIPRQGLEVASLLNKESLLLVSTGLIPALLFFIRLALNPFLVDQDGAGYVTMMESVRDLHIDTSILYPRRLGFTYIIMSINYITWIDFISIFKAVLPGLVWVSLGITASWLAFQNKLSLKWKIILSCLILISPALTGQIDRAKPETITFLFGLPTILVFIFSIKHNRPSFFILGLLYAYIAYRSHDTGLFLIFAYLFGCTAWLATKYHLWQNYLTTRNLVLAIIIGYPYILLFKIPETISQPFKVWQSFFPNQQITLSWWFLDNYQSGGSDISWQGLLFVGYYFFNGVSAVIITAALLSYLRVRELRDIWSHILPSILLTTIFLVIAEILPRFGLFYLPDRAWAELFYYSTVTTLVLTTMIYSKILPKLGKIIFTIVVINLICAVIVSLVVASSSGSLASRAELPTINKIKSLPVDSVILSTQKYNDVLVKIYGQRDFIFIDLNKTKHGDDLERLIPELKQKVADGGLEIIPTDYEKLVATEYYSVQSVKTIRYFTGSRELRSESVVSQEPSITTKTLDKEIVSANRPVYLYYSFTKASGLISLFNRKYWLEGIDKTRYGLFNSAVSQDIIHKDGSGILIRVN